MRELPPAWREDLQQVIDDAMAHKDEIIGYLDERMAEKKRGMLFSNGTAGRSKPPWTSRNCARNCRS